MNNIKHAAGVILLVVFAALALGSMASAQNSLQKGDTAFDKGDFDQAIVEYTEAIRREPNDRYWTSMAYNSRGMANSRQGDHTQAIEDFNEALRISPNNAQIYNNRGVTYSAIGDYDRAIADFESALEITPTLAEARSNLALARQADPAQDGGQTSGTMEYVNIRYRQQHVSSIHSQQAQELVYNGRAALVQRNFDRAIADLTQAIRLTPNHPLPYYLRGATYFSNSNYDAAIADYTQAIRLNSNQPISGYAYMDSSRLFIGFGGVHEPGIHYMVSRNNDTLQLTFSLLYSSRGGAYYRKGDYDASIADFSEQIRLNPNAHERYNARGFVYHAKGDYDRAIADFTQAYELNARNVNYDPVMNPNFPQIQRNNSVRYLTNRGWSYLEKRDYELAIADYTQALRLAPDNADLLNSRGLAFERNRVYFQAVADYAEAVRLDPVNTEFRANLERARQLQNNPGGSR